MARSIQVLLPLVYAVLVEAQLHLPFFDNIPGLHLPRPVSDGPREDRITHKNVGYNGGYDTWFQHFGNPDTHQFSSESHERDNSYQDFDPFYHGDSYYQGDPWDHMPGINNIFNIPNPVHNNHRHQPPHRDNPQEKPEQVLSEGKNVQIPEEKPKEIPPVDKTPIEQDKGPKLNDNNIPDVENKLNEATTSDVQNDPEELPPKTNEIKKEDDTRDKDKNQVDLDKKKDYLLVGQGNNANNVYLLHENNANPTGVITTNANQPGNNIIYVPYNPGQSNNQVYQVVNGQPATLPTNIQMTQEKLGASNGYNNVVSNPGQGTMNVNAVNQNPGYVMIYSNGQLIQIPGVVVNQAPNNVPLQNGNQAQGTNYIIANTVPNNGQTVQAIQNTGANVIYATLPSQPSNDPIYVQVPNCCDSGTVALNPANNGMSNIGLPSNMVVYQANANTAAQPAVNYGASNGYAQPNMVTNQGQGAITVTIPNPGAVFSNQNGQYQLAVQLPINSGTNGYNQPIVSNLVQGQYAPNQGMNSQDVPIQTTVQVPVDSSNNGYNQPTATVNSQRQEVNPPNQGLMYNQNMLVQPAVNMPVINGMNGYNQPMVSNQGQTTIVPNQVNNQNMPIQTAVEIPITSGYNENPPVINPNPTVETRGQLPSNQNVQPQLVVAVDTSSNGYHQPQAPFQGDQGANAIVNTPSNGAVINQESDVAQPLATSSLVLDTNNLSSLGAQPAIMISDFKDKSGDKTDNADKKKIKDKKEKKDKGKKKDKKPKGDDKVKVDTAEVQEPFTNKEIELVNNYMTNKNRK